MVIFTVFFFSINKSLYKCGEGVDIRAINCHEISEVWITRTEEDWKI